MILSQLKCVEEDFQIIQKTSFFIHIFQFKLWRYKMMPANNRMKTLNVVCNSYTIFSSWLVKTLCNHYRINHKSIIHRCYFHYALCIMIDFQNLSDPSVANVSKLEQYVCHTTYIVRYYKLPAVVHFILVFHSPDRCHWYTIDSDNQ